MNLVVEFDLDYADEDFDIDEFVKVLNDLREDISVKFSTTYVNAMLFFGHIYIAQLKEVTDANIRELYDEDKEEAEKK